MNTEESEKKRKKKLSLIIIFRKVIDYPTRKPPRMLTVLGQYLIQYLYSSDKYWRGTCTRAI